MTCTRFRSAQWRNACGQVCPSGAIPPLDLNAKRQAAIRVYRR